MPKMLLPDTNVWLALASERHVHHHAAKKWFDGLTVEVCHFCRLTQQGFLRLASNPKILKADALTLTAAWEKFDLFISDPRVSFASEPSGIDDIWRQLTNRQSFSPHLWNDAYLAAFATCADLEMVTFDKSFAQYKLARLTELS